MSYGKRMMCWPLGYGIAAEPEVVRVEGQALRCIPFHVEVGAISVVMISDRQHSIRCSYGDWDVMLRCDRPLFHSLRPPISSHRAKIALSELMAEHGGSYASSDAWLRDVAGLASDLSPERGHQILARMYRSKAVRHPLTDYRIMAGLEQIVVAELADALRIDRAGLASELHARWTPSWHRA